MNIADFVGTWYIQLRDGPGDHGMQKDSTLLIGTGSEYGDRPPFLSEEYAVCVGFAILDENGVVKLSTDPPADPGSTPGQALVLRQTGEQLRWKGYYMQQPLYIYAGRKAVHPSVRGHDLRRSGAGGDLGGQRHAAVDAAPERQGWRLTGRMLESARISRRGHCFWPVTRQPPKG